MSLLEFLENNQGRPQNMTWDEVGEQFDVTGEAARSKWRRHRSKQEESVIVTSDDPNPELEGMICIKRRETSPGKWVSSWERVTPVELEDTFEETIMDGFDTILAKYNKQVDIPSPVLDDSEDVLVVSISDCHVGSDIPEICILPLEYNAEIFRTRIMKMVDFVLAKAVKNGGYKSFVMFDLGDAGDGYDGLTTRGGHKMPQNMSSAEQWETYVDVLTEAWSIIVNAGVAKNYKYVGASNSNHGGDFDYIIMQGLSKIISNMWGVEGFVSRKAIDLLPIEDVYGKTYSYVFLHGKDKADRKVGFPLNLDAKTREYFQGVLNAWKVGGEVIVMSGDLHQSSMNRASEDWWYVKVPSLYGSSNWAVNNFTRTQPGFYWEELSQIGRATGTIDV